MDTTPRPSSFRQALRDLLALAGHAGECEKVIHATLHGRDPRVVACSCDFDTWEPLPAAAVSRA